MHAPRHALVLALFLASACGGGGGGGGTPLRNPPRALLSDVEVPAGTASGELRLGLAADDTTPTMMQLEVVTDPARIRLRPEVAQIADVGSLDAGLVAPGRLRIVFGDATTKTGPRALPVGALVTVPFDVVPGAAKGDVEVRVEAALASDPLGADTDVERTPAVARITIR